MVSLLTDPSASIPSPKEPHGLGERSINELGTRGWTVDDHFLPLDLVRELAKECREMAANGELRQAGVGRGNALSERPDIRSDRIAWLQAGQSATRERYLCMMEQIRITLNRSLFLGLHEFETHFAHYAPGAHYARHVDRFRGSNSPAGDTSRAAFGTDQRVVSAVIYLNEDWHLEEGGALRIYPPGAPSVDILPQAGRMILFLSADLPHEVLPAKRDRLSLAGWFKSRSGI